MSELKEELRRVIHIAVKVKKMKETDIQRLHNFMFTDAPHEGIIDMQHLKSELGVESKPERALSHVMESITRCINEYRCK